MGLMVQMAALSEVSLRMAFCALMGSKYAAVVAGGVEAGWLIDHCEALAREHHELLEADREAILAALTGCRTAFRDRNRLMHDVMVPRPGGVSATVRSHRRSYQVEAVPRPPGYIRGVADALTHAQHDLLSAIEDALGPESLHLAEQLRQEDAEAPPRQRARD